MARRPVAALLAVGGLALTASLYLPWQRVSCSDTSFRLAECDLAENLDGWTSGLGALTALFALAVVCLAAACFVRPHVFGAALGQCALSAGYFGIALAVRTPMVARQEGRLFHGHYHVAYGTYVGIVATAVLVLGALATPLRHYVAARPEHAVVLLVTAGLLAAFLLPWLRFGGGTTAGVQLPPGAPAAALASFVPLVYWRRELPSLGAAALLATGGTFASVTFPSSRAYGAWVGLGLAAALAVVTLAAGRAGLSFPRRAPPLLLVAAACIVSLFLPWQRICYPGRCLSTDAWAYYPATPAVALLVLSLVLVAVAPAAELTALVALFVATLGFGLIDRSELGYGFGYGAYVGFGAFASLVALALARARPPNVPRVLDCAPAMLACVAYLVIALLPTWRVLSPTVDRQLGFAPFSWLTIAAVLVAVHLFARWARRLPVVAPRDPLLVVLPLVLVALTALDLIRLRESGLTWGGGTAVALCLGLAALGVAEGPGGLRAVPIPEILRIDRIS